MSHNYAKRHTISKKNTWRENLEIPWPATKLGPFQDHPHSPRVNILEKLP